MIAVIAAVVAAVLAFLLWPCSHDWENATCTAAKVCIKCGETEGAALGHQWKKATCVDPSVCTRCKETSGVPLGHTWNPVEEKDCVEAKVITYSQCTACKTKENQITNNLASLLSEDEKTFFITPAEFIDRMTKICSSMGLEIETSWNSQIPECDIRIASEMVGVVIFYDGDREVLSAGKDKTSAFSRVQIQLADLDWLPQEAKFCLMMGFIMTGNPECDRDTNKADAVWQAAAAQGGVECDNIVYLVAYADVGVYLLDMYTRPAFEAEYY